MQRKPRRGNIKVPHEYFEMIVDHFDGDTIKAWYWFRSSNFYLGGYSPLKMILDNKEKPVLKLIKDIQAGNISI